MTATEDIPLHGSRFCADNPHCVKIFGNGINGLSNDFYFSNLTRE